MSYFSIVSLVTQNGCVDCTFPFVIDFVIY